MSHQADTQLLHAEVFSRVTLYKQLFPPQAPRTPKLHAVGALNEEMLKGLELRDPPRAEGLSEALQGPPTQPPGEQLASLSQVRNTAVEGELPLRFHTQGQQSKDSNRDLHPCHRTAASSTSIFIPVSKNRNGCYTDLAEKHLL